ncbi:DUF2971 domain-containing protein [Myxococcota bacterium]|nr:DUF2971 domain-containing protein [Myxococcota bacterium]
MAKSLTKKLYKYRPFGVNVLRELTRAESYYASPTSFNDPLDCDPLIDVDADWADVEKLLHCMLVERIGKSKAKSIIEDHRYMSTEVGDFRKDPDAQAYYVSRLARDVQAELEREMERYGVLSLAERWNCPLMWSHYADSHRGLCVEFQVEGSSCSMLKPVNYKSPRGIKISTLMAWKIDKSTEAKQRVLDTYFFAKASDWHYEREWRDVSSRIGSELSPFRISGIYFGLRCESAVVTAIIKLFGGLREKVRFYQIHPHNDTFRLNRSLVDVDEVEATGVSTLSQPELRDLFLSKEPDLSIQAD